MREELFCACGTCAHNHRGTCRAAGVLFASADARCATYVKGSAAEEYARELAPQARRIRCAKRECAYNDAMRCRAERLDVRQDACAHCASFFAL